MGTWRQAILECLRDDFEVCTTRGDAWESLLCEYLREQKEQSAPVQAARLFAQGMKSHDDAASTWPRIVDLLLETGQLYKYESVVRLSGFDFSEGSETKGEKSKGPRESKGARAASKHITNWLRMQGTAATPDWEHVRRICLEIASKNRTRNICERLMECDACCDAGEKSLLSPSELDELFADIRKRGKKKGATGLGTKGIPNKDAREQAINGLLVEEAKTWLYNTGASKEGDDGRSSSRVSDIPIDLVEKCCRADAKLGKKLGIAKAKSPMTSETEIVRQDDAIVAEASTSEIRELYSSLLEPKYANAIVPVAQDALSGLGLYVVGPALAGCGYVDAELLDHLFKYKRSADDENKPFLAIMYRYQDMSPGYFRKTDPEFFEPGSFEGIVYGNPLPDTRGTLVESLWQSVVYAWVPSPKKRFAEQALAFFHELCEFGDGLLAYQEQNGDLPKSCPERFKRYFAEEGF